MNMEIQYVQRNGRKCVMPSHIQIETVGGKGMCTARCDMCTIEKWERPGLIMSEEVFTTIVDQLEPYKNYIEYVTLHGNGEALMDKRLHDKVAYLKNSGFKGIGFATNATLLNEERSKQLILAGLDTLICSVDGAKKETHEKIRKGVNFDEVVGNINRFISIRNEIGKTRVLVRFIRQELNHTEYPEYKAYWEKKINSAFGDDVIYFNIHNWGDTLSVSSKINEMYGTHTADNFLCSDLYQRMLIFPDGDLCFCDADYNQFFQLGSMLNSHFLDLYNGEKFTYYRKEMELGKINDLQHCNHCTIPISRANKGS